MNDSDSRTHQMLVRSREFMAQNINDFVATGAARQLFLDLQADVAKVEQHAGAHASGVGMARQGTRTRGEARDALLADIDAIYNVARSMGVEARFPRPAINNDDALLDAANAYATNALPLKDDFIAHELERDFLEDLAADRAAFAAAIAEQSNARGDHIAARAELEGVLEGAVRRVRQLNGIIKAKYASNPGKLAEWAAASHIERPPRRAKPGDGSGGGTPPAPPSP